MATAGIKTNILNEQKHRYIDLKDQAKRGAFSMAQAITKIRDEELYLIEYDSFDSFLSSEFGITYRQAARLIAVNNTAKNIRDAGVTSLPTVPAQLEPISGLDADEQVEIWNNAVEVHGEKPTRSQVRETKERVLKSKADPEPEGWEAPVLLAIAQALGGIDLDACATDNQMAVECLSHPQTVDRVTPWGGRVMLAPPREVGYVDKWLEQIDAGNIEASILMLPYNPYSPYVVRLDHLPRCYFSRQVTKGLAPFPAKLVAYYFGPDLARFADAFIQAGLTSSVFVPYD